MAEGIFITFEGPDGSGKTTQIRLLGESLKASGYNVVTLRQPGGTALGDRIRSILLDSRSEATLGPVAPLAELALMFADRAQAIAEVIQPVLQSGAIVLCDRYTDSSEAYQGAGRELGSETVLALHRTLCSDLQPDLTILLLPPLDASLRRARARNSRNVAQHGTDENRFERQDNAFHERIHAAYDVIAAREPNRVKVLREVESIPVLAARILDLVTAHLQKAWSDALDPIHSR